MRESLRFPCEARYAPRARAAFETLLQTAGVDEDTRWRFVWALGEAIGSTIKHARGTATYFEIRVNLRPKLLRIDIENDGAAFDPGNYQQEDTRGFGISVMRQLSDAIAFFKNGRLLRLEWQFAETELLAERNASSLSSQV